MKDQFGNKMSDVGAGKGKRRKRAEQSAKPETNGHAKPNGSGAAAEAEAAQNKDIDELTEKQKRADELHKQIDSEEKQEQEELAARIRKRKEAFEDEDEALNFMNDRHGCLLEGGRYRYTMKRYNELYEAEILDTIDKETLKSMYENRFIRVAVQTAKGVTVREINLAKWWLEHAARLQYDGIILDPKVGREVEIGGKFYANRWEGFGVEPKKGDWKDFLGHIYRILANRNPESFKYIIRWIAWSLQNAGKQAETVIVFRGKKGTGKGILGKQLLALFGVHGAHIMDRERLLGKFNKAQLACFLFCDEAFWPGDKKSEGILKGITTESGLAVEKKYLDVEFIKNRLHLMMASNEDWVVPATSDERRYFVEDVAGTWARGIRFDAISRAYAKRRGLLSKVTFDKGANATEEEVEEEVRHEVAREKYFNELNNLMDHGGREAMLHDLLHMKLGSWHPRQEVPNTAALQQQIARSRSYHEECLMELLQDVELKFELRKNYVTRKKKQFDKAYLVPSKILTDYFDVSGRDRISFMKRIKPVLEKIGAAGDKTRTHNVWVFPPRQQCVDAWNKEFGTTSKVECSDEWTEGDY